MASEKRQKAIDLSHHLSDLSRARQTSPLKGLAKYFGRPGLISLAGGKLRTRLTLGCVNLSMHRYAERGVLPFQRD